MAEPIWQVLSPLVSPWPLVRAFQNLTPPAKPYATWSLRTATPLGRMHGEVDRATGVAKLSSPLLLRVEVSLFGKGALDKAGTAELLLSTNASLDRMGTWGLALARMPVVNNLSGVVDDPQHEERAVIELALNATSTVDDLLGVIEHVVLTPVPQDDPMWTHEGCAEIVSDPDATTQPPA